MSALMRDKPGQDHIPSEKSVAELAELAIWVAWANELRSREWDITYNQLDVSARQDGKIKLEGGGIGETFLDGLQMVLEDLEPLNQRRRAFPTTWIQVKGHTAKFVSPEPWKATPVDNYTDLRS